MFFDQEQARHIVMSSLARFPHTAQLGPTLHLAQVIFENPVDKLLLAACLTSLQIELHGMYLVRAESSPAELIAAIRNALRHYWFITRYQDVKRKAASQVITLDRYGLDEMRMALEMDAYYLRYCDFDAEIVILSDDDELPPTNYYVVSKSWNGTRDFLVPAINAFEVLKVTQMLHANPDIQEGSIATNRAYSDAIAYSNFVIKMGWRYLALSLELPNLPF